jgi:hypothetical protein
MKMLEQGVGRDDPNVIAAIGGSQYDPSLIHNTFKTPDEKAAEELARVHRQQEQDYAFQHAEQPGVPRADVVGPMPNQPDPFHRMLADEVLKSSAIDKAKLETDMPYEKAKQDWVNDAAMAREREGNAAALARQNEAQRFQKDTVIPAENERAKTMSGAREAALTAAQQRTYLSILKSVQNEINTSMDPKIQNLLVSDNPADKEAIDNLVEREALKRLQASAGAGASNVTNIRGGQP